MPWGHRSNARSHRSGGRGTSAWTTAGETASLRNACAQYNLTEEQIAMADPPIPYQWRSCHGNSYAVVKLSDVAALKRRLLERAAEAKKAALVAELGEEGYEKKVAEAAAAAGARRRREEATRELKDLLQRTVAASGSGVAPTLEGMTIGKTAARTEWFVKPEELKDLPPVDPSKKHAKYRLADVIGVADGRRSERSCRVDQLDFRIKDSPDRLRLYARYLHDKLAERSRAIDDDNAVQAAYDEIRGDIAKTVKEKAAAVKRAQEELASEENRLAAFDELVEGMAPSDGAGKKRSVKEDGNPIVVDENTENGSKKPAAKKRKGAKKNAMTATANVNM